MSVREDVLDLRLNCPVIAVLGRKNSGKTAVIEYLVPKLRENGFSIATVKHISHGDFSIDRVGSDTWRHSRAGANPVVAFSRNEISVIIRSPSQSLEEIARLILEIDADILLLEGFSSTVLSDKSVGKIICVKNLEEYGKFKETAEGEIIAFCSLKQLGESILKIKSDLETLAGKTLGFIRKRKIILEILDSLAGLDCGKCGRKTCEDLAEEIYAGAASINECIPLSLKPKLNAKITVGGKTVPLQPFVSEIVRRTVLGMISSLKNVDIKGDERVNIEIIKKKPKR